MRFGLQLFAASSAFLADPHEFCQKAHAAGLTQLEPCIVLGDPIPGLDAFWDIKQFASNYQIMLLYGLKCSSAHIISHNLTEDIDKLYQLKKAFGISQFIIKCPHAKKKEDYALFADEISVTAEAIQVFGGELLLHNEQADSTFEIDRMCACEWVLRHCGGKVGLQADTGWLLAGGHDPESFLWRNRAFIRSLHYKDMDCDMERFREVPLGQGQVNIPGCFQFARAMEIPQILDQDSYTDLFAQLHFFGKTMENLRQYRENTSSILRIMDVNTGKCTTLHTFPGIMEAPNWCQDGNSLVLNGNGRLWRYSIADDSLSRIETCIYTNCNNDHVLSADGTQIAFSSCPNNTMVCRIYTVPLEGGRPSIVTRRSPSFLHGWSCDMQELAYCALNFQDDSVSADIYTVNTIDGREKKLTQNAGYNDGPEYAPGDQHIWFHSNRSGLMQIYRMDRNGGNQEQITFMDRNNWFPHISPDGQQIVFISYSAHGVSSDEHLPNMPVELWLMDSNGQNQKKILDFFGGQGSINVNSWSPDSTMIAFVEYQLHHP